MTYFEPEFTQPDDLILVDGNYYGVFNVDGDDYSMPVLVFVDDTSALLEGATPSFVGTKAEWEEANNRLFVDIMDYSQIKNPENQTWEDLDNCPLAINFAEVFHLDLSLEFILSINLYGNVNSNSSKLKIRSE